MYLATETLLSSGKAEVSLDHDCFLRFSICSDERNSGMGLQWRKFSILNDLFKLCH